MNAVVCSVKSYSEVSSRDYLIVGNKHICLRFESWFKKKNTETKGKSFEKPHFKLSLDQ